MRNYELKPAPRDNLPKKLINQLENPATVPGTRHAEMLPVILQLVGNRVDDEEIYARMHANYPHESAKAIRDAIAGAHKKNPTPTRSASSSGPLPARIQPARVNHHRFRLSPESAEPAPKVALSGVAASLGLLRALFRPEEVICITNTSREVDGKHTIADKGTFWTLEQWEVYFNDPKKRGKKAHVFDCDSGAWMRINPCRDESGSDAGVSDYRHCLVELEKKQLSPDEQWSALKQSGLPIAAVIDSAGGSMHAWVKVDAKNAEEFKERQQIIYTYLTDLNPDQANKNPSRFSRLPGVLRDGVEQRLLALNIGAADWAAWESEIQDHEMPNEVSVESLEGFDRDNDPNNLIGSRWLCRGGSLIIQGPSGVGKSSFLMQTAISWALGRGVFGIKPVRPLKSVVLQAENDLGDMAEMYQDVRDGMQLSDAAREEVRSQLRFYRESSRTGVDFIRIAERVVLKSKADIIFADPLLAFIGADISKQEVVSQFFRNWLNPMLDSTGVLWVWLHHFGKPRQPVRGQSMGASSYDGMGSSEIVNWARAVLNLTPGEDGDFDLSVTKRPKRHGMTDIDGLPSNSIRLVQAKDRIHWERAPKMFAPAKKPKEVEAF